MQPQSEHGPIRRKAQARRDWLVPEVVEQIGLCVRTLIICTMVAAIGYFIYLAFVQFAGRTTSANVAINVLGSMDVKISIAWAVGGVGVLYGLRERRLRLRQLQKSHSHQLALEEQLDPNRTSSGLTKRGETNPKDR